MSGKLGIKGYWHVKLIGPDGKIKEERHGSNVVTTNGKEALAVFLASAAAASTANPFIHIAIGTGSTAESSSDTALAVETARKTGTASYLSGAIYQVTATFPAGTGTGAIVEYGLLSSSSAGTLFNRDVEAVINKGASDELQTTTVITLS